MRQKRVSYSRFDVAVEYPDGYRWRETSRVDVDITPEIVATNLEQMAKRIREALARRDGQ